MAEEKIKRFMCINRVSECLSCSDGHVYELIKGGHLEAIRIGKRGIRVSVDSVRLFIDRRKLDPEDFFK